MKPDWKTCFRIGVCAFLLYLCIYYWEPFTQLMGVLVHSAAPLFVGCIVAYVINILMRFYEKYYFPKSSRRAVLRSRRPVCLIGAFTTLILIIALLMRVVIPELASCIALLIAELPQAVTQLTETLLAYQLIAPETAEMILDLNWDQLLSRITALFSDGMSGTISLAAGLVSSVLSSFVTALMGLIFSLYVLAGKNTLRQKCRRFMRCYLPPSIDRKICYVLSVMDECFGRYIVGQCTEAVILGVLCAVGMLIFRFPYAAMTGAVIGFTALIPVVGAYLGGAVGFLLILTVSPVKAVFFLVYLVVLQQLEGNLIYPKVVGSSLGLPGIWVLAAVIVGGGLSGIAGVLLSVPLAATLYRLLRTDMKQREAKS